MSTRCCSHKLCRIDAFQPLECANLSLLHHNGAVGLQKTLFFGSSLVRSCMPTLESITPGLLLTPAAIFFINSDLLCCCWKRFISSAVATLLQAYCVVRVDLHFSQDLIKNVAATEVCNLGAGEALLLLDRTAAAPSFRLSPKHVRFSIVGLGKYRRRFVRPFFLRDCHGVLV